MNTCPEQIIHLMHAHLDGDISHEEERQLNEHLDTCTKCKELMNELNNPIILMRNVSPIQAPQGFVDGVMARLPKEKSRVGIQRWLRNHPILAAAAMFLVLMSASMFSSFDSNQNFSVTKQPNLIVDGEMVIVPAGEVVKGDIVVENGNLRIEGEVEGNVTVIKGSKYMASTAVVTGTYEEIDKAFDWLWYKVKKIAKETFSTPQKDSTKDEE
ncbi:zf-HC2 domain-containing protein [Sporosarcina sp. CAU 1771]